MKKDPIAKARRRKRRARRRRRLARWTPGGACLRPHYQPPPNLQYLLVFEELERVKRILTDRTHPDPAKPCRY